VTADHAYYGCNVNGVCEPPKRVGSFPLGAGTWGHMDLAGNVAEWLLDRIPYQCPNEYKNPCHDCVDDVPGSSIRPIRGGAFSALDPADLRVAVRGEGGAHHRSRARLSLCAIAVTK
jgi:formylglycine-generating enzyme required for sulfatase activity